MKGHIRKRGRKSWAIKIDIGPDPETGRRRTRWHTVKGTLRDAQAERTRLLHELNTGDYVEPSQLSLTDYLKDWLDRQRHNVSAKTHERYSEIVRKHLIPALGHHRLAKLKPLHIQRAHTKALEEGRRDGKGGLSALTVKHHHRVLSQALRQAVRLQLIPRNPCEAIDPPRPERKEMKVLNREDVGRLLKEVDGKALHIPVLLAVLTGMRRGEVLALRWQDVDLDRATLAVTQTLEQTAAGLAFKPPKTARSRRKISLSPHIIDKLRRHRNRQKEQRLRAGPMFEDHDLVCSQEDGRPRNPRTLTKEFRRLTKRLGLAVRFHDLRHTHISLLFAEGVHPKVASEIAGHASVAITLDTYSHMLPGLQEDAADRLDAALQPFLDG